MPTRGLALLFCLVAVGGRYAADVAFGGGDAWQRGVEVLTAALCAAVVAGFSADDPPRRPWVALLVAMALIPLIRLSAWLGWDVFDVQVHKLLLIVGNVFLVGTIVGFARVLGGSELLSERTGDARLRAALVVGALALCALAFIGYNVWELVQRGTPTTPDGWAGAISSAVSTLSDAIVFAGGLYLVWLLQPLVGGSIARPYLLMALGGAAFLVVDVALVAAGQTAQTDLSDRTIKLIGTLAYSSFAAAALIQVALLRAAGRRG